MELSDLRDNNLPGMIQKNKFNVSNQYDGPDDFNPTQVGATPDQLSITSPIRAILGGVLGSNLYSPTNQYELRDFALSETGRDQQRTFPTAFQSAVNNGVNIIKGGGFNIQNTLVGRLIGPNTRLAQIGLAKVAEQLAFNIGDNLREELVPSIDLRLNPFNLRDSELTIESRRAFQITRPSSGVNRVIDTASRILGLEFPTPAINPNSVQDTNRESLLQNTGKGQIKQLLLNLAENRYAFSREYLTKNPDASVIAAYMDERNVATYLYEDDRKNERFLLSPQDNDTIESFTVGYREEKEVIQSEELGFGNQDRINGYFDQDDQIFKKGLSWGDNEESFNIRRGILRFTQNLVASTHPISKNIQQISNRENTNDYYQNDEKSYKRFGERNSKGLNNIFHSDEDRRNLVFARTWNVDNEYGDVFQKLVRNGDPSRWKYSNGEPYRILNEDYSVITETGLPRIHPESPNANQERNLNLRRLMLSMENLAWRGFETYLPECEKGTFGGRIMWFPPYDLQYSESVAVAWDRQTFLGRPEGVYTYQGTTRSASLSFTLLADYPSVLDYSSQIGDNWKYNSYFQGAYVYDNIQQPGVTNAKRIQALEERIKEIDRELQALDQNVRTREDTNSIPADVSEIVQDFPKDVTYYFENDVAEYVAGGSSYNSLYDTQSITLESNGTNLFEQGNPSNIVAPASYTTWNRGNGRTITIPAGVTRVWFGNNTGFDTALQNLLDDASQALQSANTKALKVIINAYASNLASDEYNVALSRARGNTFKTLIENFFSTKTIKPDITFEVIPHGEPNNNFDESGRARTGGGSEFVSPNQSFWSVIDESSAREERKVKIEFLLDQENIARRNDENENIIIQQDADEAAISELLREKSILEQELQRLRDLLDGYCRYFKELKLTDPTRYSRYEDRIKYFEAAFHSQTPEDLNTRVTFLQQCTRPGKPLDAEATGSNSLFGTPPVIILRIGDYFHTKIIINSINFEYQDASWDYNPEGIGMQPMMAKISITFDIIGGMSLQEPINQLQNALSFNYYANTHVYDDRATRGNAVSGETNSDYVNEVLNDRQTIQPPQPLNVNLNTNATVSTSTAGLVRPF